MQKNKKYALPLFILAILMGGFFMFAYDDNTEVTYDESNDWCKSRCSYNGMQKLKYTSSGSSIICICRDNSDMKLYQINVFGN